MINLDNVKITTGTPMPIHRTSSASSEIVKAMLNLELDEDNTLEISSDSDKDHKAIQRNINVIMKKLKNTHPEMKFVTRTISIDEDGAAVLGVYRIK